MADQLVDVLHRACKAMERQPKLVDGARCRSLSSADPGVERERHRRCSRQIARDGRRASSQGLDAELRDDILRGHRPRLVLGADDVGQRPPRTSTSVVTELETAARLLIEAHDLPDARKERRSDGAVRPSQYGSRSLRL